ncbi:DUF192 domain-containing protein [soil metagenome]
MARNLPDLTERLIVQATGRVLARELQRARTARERSRGLLGTRSLPSGAGLLLELPIPIAQVHTFAMRYPIDVVWLDEDWIVKRVVRAMPPWRLSRPVLGVHRVVEMGAGSVGDDVQPGVRLCLKEED